jgi:hypothetical protein
LAVCRWSYNSTSGDGASYQLMIGFVSYGARRSFLF